MNDKNFLNLHVLISHSPSCLNRDDMNMQKSAVFGGVRRVRISSQSLKRAMRKSDYYRAQFGEPSFRSRNLEKITAHLIAKLKGEFDEEVVRKTAALFVQAKSAEEADDDAEEGADEGAAASEKGLAVAPWCAEEIRLLCGEVGAVMKEGFTDDEMAKLKEKHAKQKPKKGAQSKPLQEFIDEALTKKIAKRLDERTGSLTAAFNQAVDIALSGRMATSGLMTSVDGAIAVAHAITTHAVDADIDWFTAVDDLTAEEGETGAGHLNTQEFSAGVFYRYASLNLGQLQKNLGDADRARALKVAAHIAHLFATVVPSAKQQTFAAHNPADLVIASFSDQPLSLANAFESPIKAKGEGFLKPSAEKLVSYWKTVTDAFSLNDRVALFSTLEVNAKPILTRLADLERWIAADGLIEIQ
jgi:CRISPR system Cascade subunit CasC